MNKDAAAPPPPGPRARLRRVEGIAWRVIDEEAVLVNVRSDEVVHLNRVACLLWYHQDGRASLEEIARSLTEEYDVNIEAALADAVAFAESLVEQGAAEIVELE